MRSPRPLVRPRTGHGISCGGSGSAGPVTGAMRCLPPAMWCGHRGDATGRSACGRRPFRRPDTSHGRQRRPGGETRLGFESVDPARKLFDVSASGPSQSADVARAYEFGVLATAAQLVGAAQTMLDKSVAYAKQRSQFGHVIGGYQAIKHKLADVHIAVDLPRPLVYGAALSWPPTHHTPNVTSVRPSRQRPRPPCSARAALQTHGAIGYSRT